MIDFSAQQVLKVKKRDGSELDLTLKHVPFKEEPNRRKRLQALDRRHDLFKRRESDELLLEETQSLIESGSDNKEIKDKLKNLEKAIAVPIPEALSHYDHAMGVIAELVESFNEPDFADMSAQQLSQIIEALHKMMNPSGAEKKSE